MADEEIGETKSPPTKSGPPVLRGGAAPARRCPPAGRARGPPGHKGCSLGPVGQRVPPHQKRSVPPGGLRDGQLHLPPGHPDSSLVPEPGARQADRGDVQRTRVGHERAWTPRPRARSRRVSACASTSTTTSGLGHGRVHRGGHGRQGRGREELPQQSGQAVHVGPLRQDFWTLLQTGHVPRARDGHLRLPHRPSLLGQTVRSRARTSSCPTSPRRSTRHASWR